MCLTRKPSEWLAMFADPMRAQSAIDRLTGNACDLIIEGESSRQRLKRRASPQPTRSWSATAARIEAQTGQHAEH